MSHSNVEKMKSNSKSRQESSGHSKNKAKSKSRSKSKRTNTLFNLTNADRKQKNFMYQNITKGKCYDCNFSESNFDYVSFRGASMKSCKFIGASFKGAEFVGTNLKESDFTNAVFENAVFESAKLVDVNFRGATFINTIFLSTDISEAKNIDSEDDNITIYKEMPELEISDDLRAAVETAMANQFVKKARVLDTREGKINNLSLMILLERFDEVVLIKGLSNLEAHIDRDFYTLSFIIGVITKLQKSEVI